MLSRTSYTDSAVKPVVEPLAGAGPADSLYELGQSFRNADVDAMVFNAAAAGIDMLGAIANPLDTLGTSAIGWLLEHISFLRPVLNWTAGNPDAVQTAVQRWNDMSLQLIDVADQQGQALRTQMPTYLHGRSTSAPEFEAAMEYRAAQIRGAGMTCAEVASQTAQAGALVGAVRGVIRDMIADFVWRVLRWAVQKLALATMTWGASVVELMRETVTSATKLYKNIVDKLDELTHQLQVVSRNLDTLARRFDALLKPHVTKGFTFPDVAAGLAPLAFKVPLDLAKESTKVSTTETVTTDDADMERSRQLHERLPAHGETTDWWMKKGQL